jgi:linoleoyl-CoA desaturase
MDQRSNSIAAVVPSVPERPKSADGASRTRVRFARATPDHAMQEMKARVATYFETRRLSSKANAGMVVKTVLLLALTFVPYGLILTNRFSRWEMLALSFVMGVGMAGIGFGIAHDALHGAYSASPRINAVLGMSFDVLGASSYLWKITHNIVHHTYTNIEGVDEDLAVSPLLRLSPNGERFWFHRFQHLYAFALYGFTTLFWVFVKDYVQLMKSELGPYRDKRHDTAQLAILFSAKLCYYGYALVVPLLVLQIAWWQVLIGFFVMHFTAGAILGIVFQLAHVVESTDYPAPDDGGMMPQEWWLHEMQTTANFGPRNRLLSWYVGGLNFQVEHHLFPRVCSVHYPAISAIVSDVAAQYGLPYNAYPTLRAAIASHYRTLRQFGSTRPVSSLA